VLGICGVPSNHGEPVQVGLRGHHHGAACTANWAELSKNKLQEKKL
jgi:hypothetical protein